MTMNRRQVFKIGAGLLAFSSLPHYIRADTTPSARNIIVKIFLRGAADGAHMISPKYAALNKSEDTVANNAARLNLYKNIRGAINSSDEPITTRSKFFSFYQDGIKYVMPNNAEKSGLATPDINYMLHPDFKNIEKLLNGDTSTQSAPKMSAILGVGGQATTSHFEAQDAIEWGKPYKSGGNATGWLHEAITRRSHDNTDVAGISYGSKIAESLRGFNPSTKEKIITLKSLTDFGQVDSFTTFIQNQSSNNSASFSKIKSTTKNLINLQSKLSTLTKGAVPPAYNGKQNSQYFHDAATLIAADNNGLLGIDAITIDLPLAWDTHTNQVAASSANISSLDSLLSAFIAELETLGVWNRTTVLVISEFGRTVDTNGTGGTDHGNGSVAFVASGLPGFKAGQLFGASRLTWPTSMSDASWKSSDRLHLPTTIDYRHIYHELLKNCYGFGDADIATCLKGYLPSSTDTEYFSLWPNQLT